MIAIVDYGVGNLRSVEKALEKLGHPARITADPRAIEAADRVILPGVGAFGAAMDNFRRSGLAPVVLAQIEAGKPLLGICVGMQMLFTESEELGRHAGLNVLPGRVVRFRPAPGEPLKVPHMGWNALRFPRPHPLTQDLRDGDQVYFVHSYYCAPDDPALVAATCTHGVEFCAAAARGNLFATQFHPEKSGAVGLKLLDRFATVSTESLCASR